MKKNTSISRSEFWMHSAGLVHYSFCNVSDESCELHLTPAELTRLQVLCPQYDKFLALGNTASSVLKKLRISHFRLPHPSSRNRQFNDKKFEEAVVKQCAAYINSV